ncbi:hypothetical protein V8F20_007431 [Naviculisporaceae sp. PSN 640]
MSLFSYLGYVPIDANEADAETRDQLQFLHPGAENQQYMTLDELIDTYYPADYGAVDPIPNNGPSGPAPGLPATVEAEQGQVTDYIQPDFATNNAQAAQSAEGVQQAQKQTYAHGRILLTASETSVLWVSGSAERVNAEYLCWFLDSKYEYELQFNQITDKSLDQHTGNLVIRFERIEQAETVYQYLNDPELSEGLDGPVILIAAGFTHFLAPRAPVSQPAPTWSDVDSQFDRQTRNTIIDGEPPRANGDFSYIVHNVDRTTILRRARPRFSVSCAPTITHLFQRMSATTITMSASHSGSTVTRADAEVYGQVCHLHPHLASQRDRFVEDLINQSQLFPPLVAATFSRIYCPGQDPQRKHPRRQQRLEAGSLSDSNSNLTLSPEKLSQPPMSHSIIERSERFDANEQSDMAHTVCQETDLVLDPQIWGWDSQNSNHSLQALIREYYDPQQTTEYSGRPDPQNPPSRVLRVYGSTETVRVDYLKWFWSRKIGFHLDYINDMSPEAHWNFGDIEFHFATKHQALAAYDAMDDPEFGDAATDMISVEFVPE